MIYQAIHHAKNKIIKIQNRKTRFVSRHSSEQSHEIIFSLSSSFFLLCCLLSVHVCTCFSFREKRRFHLLKIYNCLAYWIAWIVILFQFIFYQTYENCIKTQRKRQLEFFIQKLCTENDWKAEHKEMSNKIISINFNGSSAKRKNITINKRKRCLIKISIFALRFSLL